jgi:hypothetical protein
MRYVVAALDIAFLIALVVGVLSGRVTLRSCCSAAAPEGLRMKAVAPPPWAAEPTGESVAPSA